MGPLNLDGDNNNDQERYHITTTYTTLRLHTPFHHSLLCLSAGGISSVSAFANKILETACLHLLVATRPSSPSSSPDLLTRAVICFAQLLCPFLLRASSRTINTRYGIQSIILGAAATRPLLPGIRPRRLPRSVTTRTGAIWQRLPAK